MIKTKTFFQIFYLFRSNKISCVSDRTNSTNTPKEQLKRFIQTICNTMQNEQQTENQLEIQGFMKEWNNQRKWLLNQVRKSSES